jgi:Protein of unknown function (DUF3237)/Thiamine pyrophosphate enzyme, N-terminal TPP binding domain
MTKPPRGADIVARSLARLGCRHVFALSGNHVMSIFDAALEAKLDLVHVRHEVLDRIARGEVVKASGYDVRTAPFFETASEKYKWLDGVIAVSIGHRLLGGPVSQASEVL